jgi:hypothetical protein
MSDKKQSSKTSIDGVAAENEEVWDCNHAF